MIPENRVLEDYKSKDKELNKLWDKIRLLQTTITDDVLDSRITTFKRRITVFDAFYVFKEVLINLKILDDGAYAKVNKSLKITRDACDTALDSVNRRISQLVHDKDLLKRKRL